MKIYLHLPEHLDSLYIEVVRSLNVRNFILCAGGIRALLEGICVDKGITKGLNKEGRTVRNLEGKINGLTDFVPLGIVKNLHGLRFLGNQALHELEIPDESELRLALNVVEDILNIVYDFDYRSQALFEKISGISNKKQAK